MLCPLLPHVIKFLEDITKFHEKKKTIGKGKALNEKKGLAAKVKLFYWAIFGWSGPGYLGHLSPKIQNRI